MKPRTRHVLPLCLLLCSGLTGAIEPISTSIAVGMAATLTAFLASYQNILYHFHECCRPEWISFNKTGNASVSGLHFSYYNAVFRGVFSLKLLETADLLNVNQANARATLSVDYIINLI